MSMTIYDELEQTMKRDGGEAAVRHLCDHLREKKEYGKLFYALLMDRRRKLGLSPVPSAADLPPEHQTAFEDGIREAGRVVGDLYLKEGNLPEAWVYFRMLGEHDKVKQALDRLELNDDGGEDTHALVQIAFYENVHPKKGFDWILDRFGLCNAITTMSSVDIPFTPEVKQYCLGRLVQTLYQELRERLAMEVERVEEKAPPEAGLPEGSPGVVGRLIEKRDWLFEEDSYHVDISHLSSVVQMSMHVTDPHILRMARELCGYGRRLSTRFGNPGDPPFEDLYVAADHYLGVIAGEDVEEGLAYFRAQAEQADPETIGTYPAEVLVNLLLRVKRDREALEVAKKYLLGEQMRRLSCPSVPELCEKVGDYRSLAEAARRQDDAVHFVAGLLGDAGET
jgi:hypothetical protein